MYAAFGVSSPFLPTFFQARGLGPEQLGILFGTGTAIRLVAGPLVGRLADLTQALRGMLAACELSATLVALGLLVAPPFTPLLLISLAYAAALAPTTSLADALALAAAEPRAEDEARAGRRFEYGWVPGTGSGVFVVGTLVSGQLVDAVGLASIVVLQAALLAAATGAALLVPEPTSPPRASAPEPRAAGVVALLRVPAFRRVMLVSALVLGSLGMHDTFAVIRWREAGVGSSTASVLWSESVAAEVVVFFVIDPWLLGRLRPAGVIALAATAGVARWVVVASSASVAALAVVQPLHGLTFAALHLACMRVIPAIVPHGLAATAQAMYALGAGLTTALVTLGSGWLYGALGAHAFLLMALLCAAVPPLTWRLRAVHSMT